jgi:hypothetical protein
VSAVKKAIGFWLVTWIFLQGSAQAQSGPGATRLEANNEIPSFLVGALASQPRTAGEPIRSAPAQQFVCNTGYTQKQCDAEMVVLRKVLAKYPAAQLGTWTWVLVRSEDWKPILQSRGLHPDIPALSDLGQRTTFIEEALMGQASVRASHLIERWDMNIDRLLDFAVAHELGHTLCNEKDERKANRVAGLLEQRKPVSCGAKIHHGTQTRQMLD